ncbi:uncharacterized protein LOC124946191 [Impatiens glandulifera]|uniref:uncharacterized protein LOC124946191 n=1 Tax=Impatiens glandulifera TaxID=253017 RepID=UPI001FB145E2|nr:uncharacterized protein LOC124946191 [Impatiens glandulifera]
MSLGCLVCHHRVESPSHSFRSYSVSSSENDNGRCLAITNCLVKKITLQNPNANTTTTASTIFPSSSSKVTPQPSVVTGTPRLVRSRAVRRDIVRDWNFGDEVVVVVRER